MNLSKCFRLWKKPETKQLFHTRHAVFPQFFSSKTGAENGHQTVLIPKSQHNVMLASGEAGTFFTSVPPRVATAYLTCSSLFCASQTITLAEKSNFSFVSN